MFSGNPFLDSGLVFVMVKTDEMEREKGGGDTLQVRKDRPGTPP